MLATEPVVIKGGEKGMASWDTDYLRTNVIVDIVPKLSSIDGLKGHGGIVVWVAEQMRDRLRHSDLSVTVDLVIDLQDHASTIYSVGG